MLFCSRKKRNGPALVPGVTLVGVSSDVEEAERGGFLTKEVNQLLAHCGFGHELEQLDAGTQQILALPLVATKGLDIVR